MADTAWTDQTAFEFAARKVIEQGQSNFEAALRAERKLVVRIFHHYSGESRANHAASFRLGHQQRCRLGEFFYTHPTVPGVAFSTRKAAAEAALRRSEPQS